MTETGCHLSKSFLIIASRLINTWSLSPPGGIFESSMLKRWEREGPTESTNGSGCVGFDEAIWEMIALSITIYLLDFVQDNQFFHVPCLLSWHSMAWKAGRMHYLIAIRDAVASQITLQCLLITASFIPDHGWNEESLSSERDEINYQEKG